MRLVLYVAHPPAPTPGQIRAREMGHDHEGAVRAATEDNIARAMRWLSWLRRSFPEVTFIAPWIAAVLSGEDDSDPAQREAGLVDADTIVPRCDGIVLVGGRVSSGMARERGHARRVWDLTGPAEPPLHRPEQTWGSWAATLEVVVARGDAAAAAPAVTDVFRSRLVAVLGCSPEDDEIVHAAGSARIERDEARAWIQRELPKYEQAIADGRAAQVDADQFRRERDGLLEHFGAAKRAVGEERVSGEVVEERGAPAATDSGPAAGMPQDASNRGAPVSEHGESDRECEPSRNPGEFDAAPAGSRHSAAYR